MVFDMESIYYSPNGYWKGEAAINKLANVANVTNSGRLVIQTGKMAN
jgi:hypothetical protein